MALPKPMEPKRDHVHGTNGVWYGGDWLDIEDCDGTYTNLGVGTNDSTIKCSTCDHKDICPRSHTRTSAAKQPTTTTKATTTPPVGVASSNSINSKLKQDDDDDHEIYDIVIIGAGCIGAAIARELAKYRHITKDKLSVLVIEAADDVSQGATKGNSGIVHAGYDDKPGTNRAKYCWQGNHMFAQLDKELRFGYQKNGSLVIAMNNDTDRIELQSLLQRGIINGVQNLRIIERDELIQMEPYISTDAVAALYSPDAGNVIPYEYTIALLENAIDNGIELRIRTIVTRIEQLTQPNNNNSNFILTVQQWEPKQYVDSTTTKTTTTTTGSSDRNKNMSDDIKPILLQLVVVAGVLIAIAVQYKPGMTFNEVLNDPNNKKAIGLGLLVHAVVWMLQFTIGSKSTTKSIPIDKTTSFESIVKLADRPIGSNLEYDTDGSIPTKQSNVTVKEMLIGGSGSITQWDGQIVKTWTIECRNVINCAGGNSDTIANMINDYSFKIKPRIGDYLLLSKKQGYLAKHTLFPCPDPKLGKGVLVQTTLWGNLILGPTARDMHDPDSANMTPEEIQHYILSLCKRIVPTIDAGKTFHAFAGARAKSDRGDWIIEPSKLNQHFLHVAGIDSPGLAGSPAIAIEVVNMIQRDGLVLETNPYFKKDREPIITPKRGMTGLKIGPVGKYDTDGINEQQMASNVICKCEKVTELEVVRAIRRSIPIDSSQAIRKRTRAGMGSCQAKYDNYNCEARVRAIIARETSASNIDVINPRPWPATSTLVQRWLDDPHREQLVSLMNQ